MNRGIYTKPWSRRNSFNLRFNSLWHTSWKFMAQTLRYKPVPEAAQTIRWMLPMLPTILWDWRLKGKSLSLRGHKKQ